MNKAIVNSTLIGLYWSIREYITTKITKDGWGQGTVTALAECIQRRQPNARGFSSQTLWRMRQFYEIYHGRSKLSPLVRELSWTHRRKGNPKNNPLVASVRRIFTKVI